MSIINHKYKHIFIHIPKNAGTSMETRHYVGGCGHDPLCSLINYSNKDYIIWGFVRNPYDKIVSLYNFWKKENVSMANCSFPEFIKHYVFNHTTDCLQEYLKNQQHFNVGIQPQHLFFENSLVNIKNIFIGKYENIDQDFKSITEKISKYSGININYEKLPKLNPSKRGHYRDFFTKDLFEIINEVYRKDFKLFCYKMET